MWLPSSGPPPESKAPWSARSGGHMASAVHRDLAVSGRPADKVRLEGGSAASRAHADGVHGRIRPSRPSVRRGTLLYASWFSRRRRPSARTLTTRWRWRTGLPVDWREIHARQLPSLLCCSQHSRCATAPLPRISTIGGDHGVRSIQPATVRHMTRIRKLVLPVEARRRRRPAARAHSPCRRSPARRTGQAG